jgi:hypothetical protein
MNAVESQLIKYAQEGMTVYDRQGNKIGKVSLVYAGPDDYMSAGSGLPVMDVDESLLPEAVRSLFPPDRVPTVVRQRLFQTGFLKINTGLLAADRYALADQVEVVRSDSIFLKVDKAKTLKF